MNENQVFEILQKAAGNPRDARIVHEWIYNRKTCYLLPFISYLRVFFAKHSLQKNTPISKIIGRKWFYGLEFYTNKHTLCPRPDSETLIEQIIKDNPYKTCCPQHKQAFDGPNILDIGTGTGCLIISLINNIPNSRGVGIDISVGAIRVAKRNVKKHNLSDYIKIIKADFTKPLTSYLLPLTFDAIVSNPPYIAHGDRRVNAGAMHDPHLALYAGDDGLDAYRAIAKTVKPLLKKGGKIYLEIGAGQSTAVKKIFKQSRCSDSESGWTYISSHKDLSGIIRVLVFSPNAAS